MVGVKELKYQFAVSQQVHHEEEKASTARDESEHTGIFASQRRINEETPPFLNATALKRATSEAAVPHHGETQPRCGPFRHGEEYFSGFDDKD